MLMSPVSRYLLHKTRNIYGINVGVVNHSELQFLSVPFSQDSRYLDEEKLPHNGIPGYLPSIFLLSSSFPNFPINQVGKYYKQQLQTGILLWYYGGKCYLIFVFSRNLCIISFELKESSFSLYFIMHFYDLRVQSYEVEILLITLLKTYFLNLSSITYVATWQLYEVYNQNM